MRVLPAISTSIRMLGARRQGTRAPGRTVWLAFGAVVIAFFVSNFVVRGSSQSISALSHAIASNGAPAIEQLSAVRRAVLEAELALSRVVQHPEDSARWNAVLDGRMEAAQTAVAHYLALGAPPEVRKTRERIGEGWLEFEEAVLQTRYAAEDAHARAVALFDGDVARTRTELLEQVNRAIELNAANNREMAARIEAVRRRTTMLGTVLNLLSGLLAAVLAWLLHREATGRRMLAQQSARSLEARAEELEQFAGRVAHDIRNPLSAARVSAQIALRRGVSDEVRPALERVVQSLGRADAITSALLQFARAGARPDPGAVTEPASAIDAILEDVSASAAEAGITITTEVRSRSAVACSPGVYLSLAGNLVRNAIKYMGAAEVRQVEISVEDLGDRVRTTVRDTGPGIPPETQGSIFDPYFRATRSGVEGLGLGLATVKKLAEGHGGSVGVQSFPGKGSTFWFDLPRAGPIRGRWTPEAPAAPADEAPPLH